MLNSFCGWVCYNMMLETQVCSELLLALLWLPDTSHLNFMYELGLRVLINVLINALM